MPEIDLRRVAVFTVSVLLVVVVFYALNFWIWNYALSKEYLAKIFLTQNDALFLEGMFLVIFGLMLLLGRGGISLWSVRAAILGAALDALYGRKGRRAPGPSEVFQRDTWKPSGFVVFSLVLIFAGIVLILLYFLG